MNVTRRVMFLPANSDGCAFVRMLVPHFRYPQSGYFQCSEDRRADIRLLQNYHVVLTQRQMSEANLEGQENVKKAGLRFIMDLDDSFWHIPRYNPAYYKIRRSGILANLEKAIRKSDWVTCSTEALARTVARKTGRKDRITVIENAADPVLFHRCRAFTEKETVTVGWSGTNTHMLDMASALDALWNVMRTHPNVRFETLGWSDVPSSILKEFGEHRFRHYGWIDLHRYPAFVSGMDWDLTLAPLLRTAFNESKSNVKLCESGAVQIPCVSSDVPEYRKFMGSDELLNKHLLVEPLSKEDWQEKITRLVEDRSLRLDLGQRMHRRFLESYDIRKRIEVWNKVFEEC